MRGDGIPYPDRVFARFDKPFEDPTGVDHDALGKSLQIALYCYQRGAELDRPVHEFFPKSVPETTIEAERIANVIAARPLVDRQVEAAS